MATLTLVFPARKPVVTSPNVGCFLRLKEVGIKRVKHKRVDGKLFFSAFKENPETKKFDSGKSSMIGQRNLTLSHLNPLREFSRGAEIGPHGFV